MGALRNNRGVTLVFVAMGLLIFMLFLGLALDTGWLVYVRTQAQARADSAALAAGAGLVERGASNRENRAKDLADDFSQKNSVNTTGTPENVLVPMSYASPPYGDGIIKTAIDGGWSWGNNGLNCNAVQVTTTVPTSVFFSGIRNVFGAGETGEENITVSAVSHLPCPGIKMTPENLVSMTLVKTSWSFPDDCDKPRLLDLNLGQNNAALQIATIEIPAERGLRIGDSVINSHPASKEDVESQSDRSELKQCKDGNASIVVVMDGGVVQGFAAICVEKDETGVTAVKLKCGEVAPNSAGVGECFGTYASNPILIQ